MTTTVVTARAWTTSVAVRATDDQGLRLSPDSRSAQLPLITRTGFEQRHIVTSQIGSL